VDLEPVLASLPVGWDRHAWINGRGMMSLYAEGLEFHEHFDTDLSVYGRYEAIARVKNELIYVQDDDCIVSDPGKLVEQWLVPSWGRTDHVVCNMPEPWRSNPFYKTHALVGFGAVFHRDAPAAAFQKFARWAALQSPDVGEFVGPKAERLFYDTCDVVFTGLTPRMYADVSHESLPYAYHDNRMWKQDDHQSRRQQMLDYVQAAV
jgi:hypothetical protein